MTEKTARRRYFVQRGFQTRFIAVFCVLTLIGAVAASLACGLVMYRALDEAKFRAHFVGRSTGEILLPALLKVNGVAAFVTVLCGVLLAAYVFRRSSRVLNDLCSRWARWQRERAWSGEGERAQSPASPLPPQAPCWTDELEKTFRDAESALDATYSAVAEEASQLEAAAERVEIALSKGTRESEFAGELELIGERIVDMEAGLARYQSDNGA